jgi:uncharacterized RDD family membrane protein YckC
LVQCPNCGTPNEENAEVCVNCGAPLRPAGRVGFSPYPGETTGTAAYVSYAGFWKRVGASLLDGIIVGIPLSIILYLTLGTDSATSNLISFVVQLLYKTLMESSDKQATLGKMIVGIKVTDLYGERISFGRAAGRYFASILSSLTLGIGFMMAGWTSKKQALHDMIAGTLVVNK